MTMHFFPEERERLTDEQKSRLRDVFTEESAALRGRPSSNYGGSDGGQLTPATVEQLLGEYDKVDDFLDALEELALDDPDGNDDGRCNGDSSGSGGDDGVGGVDGGCNGRGADADGVGGVNGDCNGHGGDDVVCGVIEIGGEDQTAL